MFISLLILILVLTIVYFLSIWSNVAFFGELAVSFFPYGVLIALLGLFISLGALWKKLYKKPAIPTRFQRYSVFLVLAFGTLFFSYSHTIQNFYQPTAQDSPIADIHSQSLKILFANIYKDNQNYATLQKLIQHHNPDLVLFVEFSDQHKSELASFIESNYPYINRTSRSKIFVGSVVFSKYPIENLADDFEQGMWRYAYFSVEKEGEKYYFYEVHTSSPTSNENFKTRNIQLNKIANDVSILHQQERAKDAKVIILGDFNITPRSPHYQTFIQKLPKDWDNMTRTLTPFFSWNLGEMLQIHQDFQHIVPKQLKWFFLPFKCLGAHIDHIFSNTQVQNLEVIKIPGSDHKGMVFEIP